MAAFSTLRKATSKLWTRIRPFNRQSKARPQPSVEVVAAHNVAAEEPVTEMADTQLTFNLVNRTNSNTVYAYITGRALDRNNALFLLAADGRTPYYPTSPSSTIQPLQQNCSIRLGAPGSTISVVIPHLAGARVYFSVDKPLNFYLNPGPALVEPSVANPSDTNINTNWGFAEFTWNTAQLYANISYVDFVSLPIALTLTNKSGGKQSVTGMGPDGLSQVCAGLESQSASDGASWRNLIVRSPSGGYLRALSPNLGIITNANLFKNYFQPYVNDVWSKYTSTNLAIDTQVGFGVLQGRVQNGTLRVGSQNFAQPSAADIFSNSTGPFANPGGVVERDAIIPRLAAAFNRSTLLTSTTSPDPRGPSAYYQNKITNHYSRIVHSVNADKRGYAFPYDDVAPSGGQDQSGAVFDGAPALLTIGVGGR